MAKTPRSLMQPRSPRPAPCARRPSYRRHYSNTIDTVHRIARQLPPHRCSLSVAQPYGTDCLCQPLGHNEPKQLFVPLFCCMRSDARRPATRTEDAGAAEPLLWDSAPHEQTQVDRGPERTLTLCPLVALIFFEVSGGPFGVEDAVGAAGPFYALLGFVIFPLVWSVPEALVTAELTGLFPENAGYVAWVTEAFGPFVGFVEGWCSWWSGAIDNAIYPGLFLQYLRQLSDGPDGWLSSRDHYLAALVAINVVLAYVSWRGLDFVGKAAMVLGVLAVSPFLVMTVLAVPRLDLTKLSSRRARPDWRLLLNTLMWNLNCKCSPDLNGR